MFTGIFRLILYAVLAYVIYHLVRFFTSPRKVSRASSSKGSLTGLMVKDEVCNTYLPKEDAIKELHQGRELYFCSKACRNKFLETKSR